MQAETRVYEVLQSNSSNEEKADVLCSFMSWNRNEVIEQLGKIGGGHSKDDRQNFLNHFWNKCKGKNK